MVEPGLNSSEPGSPQTSSTAHLKGLTIGGSVNADDVVGIIRKNAREHVVVTLHTWKGYNLVGIRVWAREDGELIPTRIGLNIRRAMLPDLVDALRAAIGAAENRWGPISERQIEGV